MVCKHCGAVADDGNLFCRDCGMPLIETAEPAEVPVEAVSDEVSQAPVEDIPNEEPIQTSAEETTDHVEETAEQAPFQPAEPVISLNTGAELSKPKKKGKIIAIVILAVLLAAAVFVVLNFSAIKVWFTRTFTSPEEIMTAVYKDGVTNALSSISGAYEKLGDEEEQDDTTVESEMHLRLGSQLLGMAEQAILGDLKAGNGDVSWLSDVVLKVSQTQNGQYIENSLALGLGNTTIISFENIIDSENGVQWIDFPELSDYAAQLNSAENLFATTYPTASAVPVEDYPSFELIEKLYIQLIDFVLEEIGAVETQTKSFTVGNLSQDIYVLETKFSEETWMQIGIRWMEALKADPDVKAYLDENTAEYKQILDETYAETGRNWEDYFQVDLYADFVKAMDEQIAAMEESISAADPENYLILYTYLNDNNELAGIELKVFGTDSDVDNIRFLGLDDGDYFAREIVFGDTCITGVGTDGEFYNAVFTVSGEEEIIRFEIVDAKMTEDRICGKMRIVPGSEMMEEISHDMDPATSAMLSFANLVLEIQLDAGKEDVEAKFSLLLGSMEFLSLETTTNMLPAKEVTAPENSIELTGEQELQAFIASFDIQKVLDNLVEAGFPNDLMILIMQELMSAVE